VGQPHKPETALRVEELFQLATAVVHVDHSECYGDVTPTRPLVRGILAHLCQR
jgi:hypothetical protein